jgi:hypothetical protein
MSASSSDSANRTVKVSGSTSSRCIVILHPFHEHVGELVLGAGAREVRHLRGPQRRQREEGDARELARERRHRPVLLARLRQVHDDRVGERRAQGVERLGAAADERQAPRRRGKPRLSTSRARSRRRTRRPPAAAVGPARAPASVRAGRDDGAVALEEGLRLSEDGAGIVVRHQPLGLLERGPAAGRDALRPQRLDVRWSGVSIRKKWQVLWMRRPRKRNSQSMVSIGARSASSASPVSSPTSRSAACSGASPSSRCPLGKPQLRYESRMRR